MERIVAVTGARGFIGSRLCAHLRERGWSVVELRRDVDPASVGEQRYFSLDEPVAPRTLENVDLLVHAAYDPVPVSWEAIRRTNLNGSLSLFAAAEAAGIRRVVHISTMSSFEGCRSRYGRAKLETERDARQRRFVVVRPGLVYGPGAGGMLGGLGRLVGRAPVLPLVGRGDQRLYLVHVNDLCRLIAEAGVAEAPPADPIIAAHEQPWPFVRILSYLATSRGRRVRFVPVPWRLIWAALRTLEGLGLRAGFRADSVMSLVHQDPYPDFAATRELGVELRAFGSESVVV